MLNEYNFCNLEHFDLKQTIMFNCIRVIFQDKQKTTEPHDYA